MNNYLKTGIFGRRTFFNGPPHWAKLLFLVAIAVFFSYGPLNVFAPIPLCLGLLLYGRKRCALICLPTLIVLAIFIESPLRLYFVGGFLCSCVFAIFIAESILKGIYPARAMMVSGSGIFLGFLTVLSFLFLLSDSSPREIIHHFVSQSVETFRENNEEFFATSTPEARAIREFVDDPQKITQGIIQWAFSFMFVSVFATFWIGFLAVLKSSHIWRPYLNHPYFYTHRNLLNFRLSERFVYLLILGLLLYLGEDFLVPGIGIIGGNILFCLSFFYFLQGLGIYLELLNYLNFHKFMRIILIVITVLVVWRILILVGVFDLWVNFRKFMKVRKKYKKGEKK